MTPQRLQKSFGLPTLDRAPFNHLADRSWHLSRS
jgi:hypothetical protein